MDVRLDRAGIDSLSVNERTSLIGLLIRSRDLMIYQYGRPQPSWSFQRDTVSCEELSRYSIIRPVRLSVFKLENRRTSSQSL
jgi:hypothetical protein